MSAVRPPRGRLLPVWVATLIPVAILVIWPVQHVGLPHVSGLLAMWCATVLVLDAITAGLLVSRYRSVADLRVLILATAYATSAAAIVLMMFSIPGVVSAHPTFATRGGASGWLWLMRHLGPPVLIAVALAPWPARAQVVGATARRRDRTAVVVLLAGLVVGPGALALVLGLVPDRLPQVVDPVTLHVATWAAVLAVSVNAVAVAVSIASVVRRTDTSRFEAWAVVAVVAWAGDVVLTLMYDERWSVAYYGARVLGVASSLVVVVALLREAARVQRKLARGSSDLTEQVTRLVNAAQDRDHMVAVVSHELRSPLAGLMGYLEVLTTDPEVTPELRERMQQRALVLSRRMSLLTEDLLTRSTTQHGELVLLPEELDLGRQVAETAAGFPGLELRNDVPTTLRVHADPLRLQQVLTNLVRNAQKHGAAPVTVTAAPFAGDRVRVAVADSGAGVPEEFVPHLFDRYTRGATVRAQGAGLGLSVVQDLVRAHGGEVGYEPATRSFWFTLPAGDPLPVPGEADDLLEGRPVLPVDRSYADQARGR